MIPMYKVDLAIWLTLIKARVSNLINRYITNMSVIQA